MNPIDIRNCTEILLNPEFLITTSHATHNAIHYGNSRGNERSIVNSVYNRIATDAATIKVQHVRTDSDGNYVSTIDSRLNDCLNFEANIDQTGQAFIHSV